MCETPESIACASGDTEIIIPMLIINIANMAIFILCLLKLLIISYTLYYNLI